MDLKKKIKKKSLKPRETLNCACDHCFAINYLLTPNHSCGKPSAALVLTSGSNPAEHEKQK